MGKLENLAGDVATELMADPALQPGGEIEKHAELHRRAVARYEERANAIEKAGKAELAALAAERRAAKKAYEAELTRIVAAMGATQERMSLQVAAALRLAETSRAALTVLEQEG